MIAVQVIPDRFSLDNGTTGQAVSAASGRYPHVRRPTNGIELKDETFATLRVVVGNGKNIPLIDAGSRAMDPDNIYAPMEVEGKRATDVYSNFLIQSVQEERMEKQQIVETFGEAFIFFFGERPKVITVNGVLANTFDFNWEAEWWHNYEHYLRGTKCVENDARIFLMYDQTLISGYIMSSSTLKQSQERNYVNFGFQMFVTGYTSLSRLGDPNSNQSGFTKVKSEDQLDYRPELVEYSGRPWTTTGAMRELTLVESIMNAVNGVRGMMAGFKYYAKNALVSLDWMAGTSIVRVPVGFAGALVFDDPRVTPSGYWDLSEVGGPVRMEFQDNLDEYVGSSEHYGSSDLSVGGNHALFGDPYYGYKNRYALVIEAKEQWSLNGFAIVDEKAESVIERLRRANQKLGLVDVGATREIVKKAAKGADKAQAATSDFAGKTVSGLSAVDDVQQLGRSGIIAVTGI